jgi:pimeloyl-ACP methyl ester carboxylesterase
MLATTEKTGYAAVNGLNIYYEIHGAGEPLVLLHGGLGSTATIDPLMQAFPKKRQVITVDLQAHGRTADINRPITSQAMADDMAGLLKYLNIEKADFVGYSLGASVCLQTAIRHSELVRKLVLVSTVFKRDGWYPEVLAQMAQMGPATAEMMKPSPLYKLYASVAPRPEDWVALVTKISELLKKEFDWSQDVAAIKAPTMLVFGDADAIRPAHIVEFYGLLGGGKKDAGWDGSGMSSARLAILPGVTHYNMAESPLLPMAVEVFLDSPIPGGRKAPVKRRGFGRAAGVRIAPSIDDFQRKLNLPRIPCRLTDDAKAAATHDIRRQPKIHDVEHIEELRAKFHGAQFSVAATAEGSVFDHREIEVVKIGSAECVSPQRAEASVVKAGTARNVDGHREER